jgi:hypothetical protein
MRIATSGSVNARKPRSCKSRLPAGKGEGVASAIGVAQEEDKEKGIDQQDIFDGVVLFLAAITFGLFRRVLGADDPPFRPVMGKRGEAGAAAGTMPTGADASISGVTTDATSVSETPRRCARAVRERAGASPRVRSQTPPRHPFHLWELKPTGFFQTPPDLVVKFQPLDIVDVILRLVWRLRAVYQREIKG